MNSMEWGHWRWPPQRPTPHGKHQTHLSSCWLIIYSAPPPPSHFVLNQDHHICSDQEANFQGGADKPCDRHVCYNATVKNKAVGSQHLRIPESNPLMSSFWWLNSITPFHQSCNHRLSCHHAPICSLLCLCLCFSIKPYSTHSLTMTPPGGSGWELTSHIKVHSQCTTWWSCMYFFLFQQNTINWGTLFAQVFEMLHLKKTFCL